MTSHTAKYDKENFSIDVFLMNYGLTKDAAAYALQMTLHITFLVRKISPFDFSKERTFHKFLNGNNALQMTLRATKYDNANFSIQVFQ